MRDYLGFRSVYGLDPSYSVVGSNVLLALYIATVKEKSVDLSFAALIPYFVVTLWGQFT